MAEITPNSTVVTATPAAGSTTDVNLKQVTGSTVSASNPVPVLPVANGSQISATNALSTIPGYQTIPTNKGGGAPAPTAGTAFVSLAANSLAAGTYMFTVSYCISGAAEVASNGANVRLSDASGGFTAIDLPSNNGGAPGVVFGPYTFIGTVGATQTVKLTAIAAATASTVYAGFISAFKIA